MLLLAIEETLQCVVPQPDPSTVSLVEGQLCFKEWQIKFVETMSVLFH